MSEPVVIKVGGSLLAEPEALDEVRRWFDATRIEGQTRIVIAGGGAAVDALRRIDIANPLSQAAAHWAAIQMMDTHTRLLPQWLTGLGLTDRLPAITDRGADQAFLCESFLRAHEPHRSGTKLSVGWAATSDAIAARLAEIVGGRLVLLKHTVGEPAPSLESAAEVGLIDSETPRHAASLRWVDVLGVVSPGLTHQRGG